jgi:hypothetical protein
MADRQMTTPVAEPELERHGARRVATPFLIMIALVVLVGAVVFAVVQPWEGSDTAQRDVPPIASPTAAP